ncbi:MAG: hypothetical protein K8F30_01150, partial [Taibaiella sp.]|nr:hypothetical protein [Taibaiella sp.]
PFSLDSSMVVLDRPRPVFFLTQSKPQELTKITIVSSSIDLCIFITAFRIMTRQIKGNYD